MKTSARVVVVASSAVGAKALMDALAPDNEAFVRARLEGSTLVLETQAQKLPTLLATLDDLLVAIGLAQNVGTAARGPAGGEQAAERT